MVPPQLTNFEPNTSKTITTFGSIFLFFNNTVGPGLVVLPALYQQSGMLPCALCIILLCVMSYFIGMMLTYSIRKIPHNQYDDLKVEYLDLIKYYVGFNDNITQNRTTLITKLCQLMYLLFMMAFLISSIIQTCQTFDLAIARVFGNSYGFTYFPFHSMGFAKGNAIDSISPFDNPETYTLTIGTALIYISIIPFCLKDLQEAIWIQYVGSYGTILLMVLWCFMLTFSAEFSTENVPLATPSVYEVLSVNLFNVAFICTYPSWLNEKKEHVSPKRVLKWTAIATALCFIFIGYMGGIAFYPYYMTSGDMLSKLNHFMPNANIADPTLMQFFKYFGPISCYFYPIVQCLSGIPVFCTIIRYNLINTHILKSKWSANIIAIFFPFLLSIPLYHGNGFNVMLNWSGVLFSSFVNFILPIYFYYKSVLRPQSVWNRVALTPHHKSLLQRSNIDIERLLELEIADGDIARSKCKSISKPRSKSKSKSETDNLLDDIPKTTYNTSIDVTLSNLVRKDESFINKGEMIRTARKALCFLIFTVLLTVIGFSLDFETLMK